MAFTLSSAYAVSPLCVRVVFNERAKVNAALTTEANYTITAGGGAAPVSVDRVEAWTSLVGVHAVSIWLATAPTEGGTYTVAASTIESFTGTSVSGSGVSFTARARSYNALVLGVSSKAAKLADVFRRLRALQVGRPGEDAAPNVMTRLLAALGGSDGDVAGKWSWRDSSFALAANATAGASITLASRPSVVESLDGAIDGENAEFSLSLPYIDDTLVLYSGTPFGEGFAFIEDTAWHSDGVRTIRFLTAPARGQVLVAAYVPRRNVVRVDREVVAYEFNDRHATAGAATLKGRALIGTTAAAHTAGGTLFAVWGGSGLDAMKREHFPATASGGWLTNLARAIGMQRPATMLRDRDMRRAVMFTAVRPKATIDAVDEAFRYLYPDTWPYTQIATDPRWPHRIVVWIASTVLRSETVAYTPEVWETWLEEPANSADLTAFYGAPQGAWVLQADETVQDFNGYYIAADESTDLGALMPTLFETFPGLLDTEPAVGAGSAGLVPEPMRRILSAGQGLIVLRHPNG